MHGDVPEMAANVQGKDTTHVGGHGDAMLCMGVTGLCAMSQQGLMSVTGRDMHHGPVIALCLFMYPWHLFRAIQLQ